jgi:hypothetical protein
VTGCVYNGASMPPHALPEELSKSTFKTNSTPGGDGFNELRIEDAAGSEQIFVHAQRRMDLRVRGSLYETAGGSREERVGGGDDAQRHGDHNTLVHKDVNHHVLATRYTKIDKEQYTSVGEDVVEDFQRRHMVFVGELSQLGAPRIVVESSDYISHKSNEIELAGSSKIDVKGGSKVAIESHNAIELEVGASFISFKPDGIDIQGLTIRLNSGGGVRSATEGIPALAMDLLEPLDALAADHGRPGSSRGAGAGGGSGRTRKSRTLEPHHAPKMRPPPPPKPGKPAVLPDGTIRRLLSIAWQEEEAWCSEPATLTGVAQNYADGETELVTVINSVDGATATAFALPLGDGPYEHDVEIVDILSRWIGTKGYEAVRPLLARVAGLTTAEPSRLRFITDLPAIECNIGGNRFDLHVKHAVNGRHRPRLAHGHRIGSGGPMLVADPDDRSPFLLDFTGYTFPNEGKLHIEQGLSIPFWASFLWTRIRSDVAGFIAPSAAPVDDDVTGFVPPMFEKDALAVLVKMRTFEKSRDDVVGLYSCRVTSRDLHDLRSAIEGTPWAFLPRPTGGSYRDTTHTIRYSHVEYLIERRFMTGSWEFIESIEPVWEGLMKVEDRLSPLATLEIHAKAEPTRGDPTRYTLHVALENRGTQPVVFTDPRIPFGNEHAFVLGDPEGVSDELAASLKTKSRVMVEVSPSNDGWFADTAPRSFSLAIIARGCPAHARASRWRQVRDRAPVDSSRTWGLCATRPVV